MKKVKKPKRCRCPFCDEPLLPDVAFCQVCKVDLVFCPSCGEPIPKTTNSCPRCGKQVERNTKQRLKDEC